MYIYISLYIIFYTHIELEVKLWAFNTSFHCMKCQKEHLEKNSVLYGFGLPKFHIFKGYSFCRVESPHMFKVHCPASLTKRER